MKEENENLFKEEVDLIDENYDFAIGDYASIKNTNTGGEIMEISGNKKNAVLKTGNIKMKVKMNELVPGKKVKQKVVNGNKVYHNYDVPKTRIDIRGKRSEEAEYRIVKFIDNAYVGNLEKVEILHGKGTGALKATVIEILKEHDKVKNYYFAPVELGGEGVTIVELK